MNTANERLAKQLSFITAKLLLLSLFTIGILHTSVVAQQPAVPRQKLAVDEVTLTTGEKIYGIVVEHNKRTGTEIIVERAWLKKNHPGIYATHLESEKRTFATFSGQHLARLKDWKQQRAGEQDLTDFIEEEIKLIEEENDKENGNGIFETLKFAKVKFDAAKVAKSRQRKAEHHRVAGLAWKYQLADVTSRSMIDLKKDLEKLDVDIANETFDLSADIPPSSLESDNQWNARLCIFEYIYRDRQHYQGMGSTLIKVNSEKQAEPEEMLKLLLGGGGGLGGLGALGGLGGNNDLINELLEDLQPGGRRKRNQQKRNQPKPDEFAWAKSATDASQRAGYRSVRVTKLIQDISNPIAKVEEYLFVEIAPGKWIPVFNKSSSVNRNEVAQTDVDFLKQDPQVEKVMGIFNALGAGNDQLLDTALRQGAATQQAMTESSNQFFEFIDKYTRRTDGPELQLK